MGVEGEGREGPGLGQLGAGMGRMGGGKWGGGEGEWGPPLPWESSEDEAAASLCGAHAASELPGGAPAAFARALLLTNSSGNFPGCFGEARRQDGHTSVKQE